MSSDIYLAHHGIKGQKWGVRRYQNEDGSLTTAGEKRYSNKQFRQDVRNAYKESRPYEKEYRKASNRAFGVKGLRKASEAEKRMNEAIEARDKKIIDAHMKRAASAKNEKAEMRSYQKSMYTYGLPGSYSDKTSSGKATKLYNEIYKQKGEEYAEKVLKKTQRQVYTAIAASVAVTIGRQFINAYLDDY